MGEAIGEQSANQCLNEIVGGLANSDWEADENTAIEKAAATVKKFMPEFSDARADRVGRALLESFFDQVGNNLSALDSSLDADDVIEHLQKMRPEALTSLAIGMANGSAKAFKDVLTSYRLKNRGN